MINLGVSGPRAIAAVLACVCALIAFPDVGHADLIVNANGYCGAGANPANTADTMPGSLLSVNDVTLAMVSSSPSYSTASNCYGAFDPGNSSPANETDAINDIFGPGFVFLDKTGGASDPVGLGGIKFQVHTLGGSDGALGLWSVTWTDLDLTASENLPLTIDLVVLLVGGNSSAAYLLSGLLIPQGLAFGIGTFDIQFFNSGGTQSNKCYQHDNEHHNKLSVKSGNNYGNNHNDKDDKKDCDKPKNQPSISHLTLAGRIIRVPTIEVPEPASLTMFGAGLLGLWAFGRRRSK